MTNRSVNHWIVFLDLIWSVPALLMAYLLRYGGSWPNIHNAQTQALLPFLAATGFLWMLLSTAMKLDCFRGGWRFSAMVSQLFLAVLSLMCVLLAVGYLRREYVSRLTLTYFGLFLFLGFIVMRYVARVILLARNRSGQVRKVVIVGSDRVARELGIKIGRHPEMLCRVLGFLCPEDQNLGLQSPGPAQTVTSLGVIELLIEKGVTDVILAVPKPSLPEVLNLAGSCREHGITVSFVPQPYELYLSKPSLLDLDGIPVLELREGPTSGSFFRWKRVADILLGSALSLFALPVLLPAAVAVRRIRGKAFRYEPRCGQYGKVFSMFRLNVERHGQELTGFERVLEKLSITELPQLWNVLRGEMSLVGPRPESFDRVKHYSEWEQQRLSGKPGMTGLAQVHGLRDQNSSEEKARFDLQYILHPSVLTDASILLQTLWTLTTRCLPYFGNVARSSVKQPHVFEGIAASVIEESLKVAHRSQSSAD
jgi:lipopolysaccharide/colanic/teichoic acid biosynthesis glycosyltransferase